MRTGWGEGPDETPMPLSGTLMEHREQRAGVVETALARSAAADARGLREEAAAAADPDERAANMIARGVLPGQVSDLSQRLADKSAEYQAELEKIAKGERVTARARGMLERGQIGGLDAARMMDGDFGDAHRAAQLGRQCDRLRRQLEETSALAADRAPENPLEAASRRAHDIFVEVTRERMAAAQAGRPASREPRPFASRAGLSGDAECTGPDCEVCAWGREQEAQRDGDVAPYAPGAVITTGYEAVR